MSSTADPPGGVSSGLVVPGPDTPPVGREMDGPLAVLTMQQAPHNFIGTALLTGLLEGLQWVRESGARAVLLRSGLRNFCAGADIALFESAERGVAPDSFDAVQVLRAFDTLSVPIVAAVHGVAVGGGFEIALACDLIVSSESAKIGCAEAALGLNPLMGAIQRVTQLAGAARAKEMALLARRYDPHTLERWNIINRVVPDDKLGDVSLSLARELANGPTVAHASTKAIASYTLAHGVHAADEAMLELQAGIWKSEDLETGLASLKAHGPGAARFEGR
jgi:enoyl-CoA hydratase/carnithine racemase